MSEKLIKNLQCRELYDHPIKYFRIIETHISWVILTGEYAYKIKKAQDFGFLNFTSLEKRKYYCELELSLNKKLAPEIYLDVLKITGNEAAPHINGDGKVIEYCLKMREFPQEALFDHLLDEKKLTKDLFIQTADIIANFHSSTEKDTSNYFGTPEQIFEPVQQNFAQIRELIKNDDTIDINILNQIENWTYQEHQRIKQILENRKKQGYIRACHGDIHLGNIALHKNKPVVFDCIEFNEGFRWTDVMADIGFLMMDLHEHHEPGLANIFLNRYLVNTGDYQGLEVLPYYQVYRAMVRAKIALFGRLPYLHIPEKANYYINTYQRYIDLTATYTKPKKNYILITHGFSGSGKSTLANTIAEKFDLIHLKSDVERKRIYGLQSEEKSQSGLYADMYSEAITEKTYRRLLMLTETVIHAGYAVIIDATFLKKNQREQFFKLANQKKIGFRILHCDASIETLRQWLKIRKATERISEADEAVLLAQQLHYEPLTEEEKKRALSISFEEDLEMDVLIKNLQNNLAEN